MTEIPKGAITIDGLFASPNASSGIGAIVETVTEPTDNNGLPYSIISLSGSENFTSIWSDDDYKLNFNQSFEGRTYVNFGDANQAADGFAFVMHNDSSGTTALTSADNPAADGQNLGVYGSTNAYRENISSSLFPNWVTRTPDYRAIQNSVAIEFDLNYNNGRPAAYDIQLNSNQTPHMAYTFPGSSSKGYQPIGTLGETTDNWFVLTPIFGGGDPHRVATKHNSLIALNGTISTNVRDNTWYEFRYAFDKETNIFSYYLENPVTEIKTAVTQIPWQDLVEELNLEENDYTAYWGFTAANGAASGKTQFVFTQPPVELQGSVTNDVLNDAQESISVAQAAASAEKNVTAGETVKIVSDFAVTGEASVTLNSWNVVLDPAVIDLTGNQSVMNITATDISTQVETAGTAEVNSETGSIIVQFPNLQVRSNSEIRLSFQVATKEITDEHQVEVNSNVIATEVGKTAALTFQGSATYFWIVKADSPTQLSWQAETLQESLSLEEDMSNINDGLEQLFYWQDDDVADQLQFRLLQNETVIAVTTAQTTGNQEFMENSLTIPAENLDYGTNNFTLTVYRFDTKTQQYQLQRASLNLTISVTGRLSLLEAPELLSWTNRTVALSKGELIRDADNSLTLRVLDSRQAGHDWSVGATVSGSSGDLFTLVWKNQATDMATPLSDKTTLVMDNTSANKDSEGYTYSESWQNTTGILLQSDDYLSVGDYSGQLKVLWQLYDTASPE
ncbi:lectin-like domain-containing protein [Enterococcus sp. LJL90]